MTTSQPIPDNLLDQAHQEASASAQRAGVEITLAPDAAECQEAARLLDLVWDMPAGVEVLELSTLVALSHSGNYVAVARGGGDVVGASVGFFGPPGAPLHSHITGIRGEVVGRGIGAAMKMHQRAWALDRGVDAITWTFDPLVARNAFFNIAKIGAVASAYHPEHYGPMTDGLNAGQGSDRMLMRWDLRRVWAPTASTAQNSRHVVVANVSGDPGPVNTDVPDGCCIATVEVPTDVEGLRRTDPHSAIRWRQATRDAFTSLLADHWRVTGIERPARYILTKEHQ